MPRSEFKPGEWVRVREDCMGQFYSVKAGSVGYVMRVDDDGNPLIHFAAPMIGSRTPSWVMVIPKEIVEWALFRQEGYPEFWQPKAQPLGLLQACEECLPDADDNPYRRALEPRLADTPAYNAGRLEGQADVCAELRAILDPADSRHWNKDGLLGEVRRRGVEMEILRHSDGANKESCKNLVRACSKLLSDTEELRTRINDANEVIDEFKRQLHKLYEGNPTRAELCEVAIEAYETKWAPAPQPDTPQAVSQLPVQAHHLVFDTLTVEGLPEDKPSMYYAPSNVDALEPPIAPLQDGSLRCPFCGQAACECLI